MKIDAKIKFIRARCLFGGKAISKDEKIDVPVDLDYVDDYDDVIQSIEEWLFKMYGVVLCNEVDFTIENATELCEEISF